VLGSVGIQRHEVELDMKFIFYRHDHFKYATNRLLHREEIKIICYGGWIQWQFLDPPGLSRQQELADLLSSNPIQAG